MNRTKQTIRINESQLRQIIKESVMRILSENAEQENDVLVFDDEERNWFEEYIFGDLLNNEDLTSYNLNNVNYTDLEIEDYEITIGGMEGVLNGTVGVMFYLDADEDYDGNYKLYVSKADYSGENDYDLYFTDEETGNEYKVSLG